MERTPKAEQPISRSGTVRTRRSALLGFAIVSLAAITGFGVLTLTGRVRPGPDNRPLSGWHPIADGPLAARHDAHAFWTGSEVLVVGGDASLPACPGECVDEPQVLSDGAAYDPQANSWRRIRSAPVPLGQVSGAVLDDALYVLASANPDDDRVAFLRYSTEEDVWDELDLPVQMAPGLELVAAGSQILAVQVSQETDVLPVQAFDPKTKTWGRLPLDPLAPSYDRSLVWTGRDLALIGIRLDPLRPPNRPPTYSAAILDADATSWQRVRDSEIAGSDPHWYWSGGQIVNPAVGQSDGGETNNWGRFYPFGGSLTPGLWMWSSLKEPPTGLGAYRGLTVGGSDYVIASDGWVLHVPTGRWAELKESPTHPDSGESRAWAGDRLMIWGGVQWKARPNPLRDQVGTLLDSGAVWVP